jgi:inosine-uridine nucleoside N-ribohydrolase
VPKRRVFLDTDIGSDTDDAIALAYVLCQPDCDLLGVTTVGPESPRRAEIVDAICCHTGRPDVPIAAGAERPLFVNHYWKDHHLNQAVILERWPARRTYESNRAVGLLSRVIREHPREVALVTVGQLTNAALLAATDPEAFGLLESVWIMGGRFNYPPGKPEGECNIILDPTAAGLIFQVSFALDGRTIREGLPAIHVAGLDVTRGLSLTPEETTRLLADERLAPVLACCRCRWARAKSPGQGLHDPFTASLVFRDDFCRFERGRIGITLHDHNLKRGFKLDGDAMTGATYFEPSDNGPHYVARQRDREAFLKHLWEVLGGRE